VFRLTDADIGYERGAPVTLAGTCCSFGGYPLRKRPSPSGGESVTPSLENGQVPLGENQSPRVSTTAEFLRRRISDPEFRQRPSSSGGESVTPSFDNGRVPQEENQSPRVSKTAKSIRGRRSISTMSDFHPSHSPAWPPTPMVTSSRKTAKKVRGTIGSPRKMRSTSRY
jgi:hypothetical protein